MARMLVIVILTGCVGEHGRRDDHALADAGVRDSLPFGEGTADRGVTPCGNGSFQWGFFAVHDRVENLPSVSWTRRTGLIWTKVENPPGSGNFQWSYLDDRVGTAQDLGLNVVLVIKSGHGRDFSEPSCWQAASQSTIDSKHLQSCPLLPSQEGKWRQMIEAVVERYDGDGTDDMADLRPGLRVDLQIENEAGSPHYWQPNEQDGKKAARAYLRLLELAYAGKQAANPSTQIIAPGLIRPHRLSRCATSPPPDDCAGQFETRNREFTLELLRFPQHFDALDIHFFNYFKFDADFIDDGVSWVRAQMQQHGYSRPLYSLEWTGAMLMMVNNDGHLAAFARYFPYTGDFSSIAEAWPTYANLADAANAKYRAWFEAEQARELPKLFTTLLARGVDRLVHVQFSDYYGQGWDNPWWNWQGLIRYEGTVENYQVIEKPSFHTFKLLEERLAGSCTAERVDPKGSVHLNRLTSPDKPPVMVAWTEGRAGPVDLSQHFASASVVVSSVVTALDQQNQPVITPDLTVSASAVPLSGTPLLITGQ